MTTLKINGKYIQESLDKICHVLDLNYAELNQKIKNIPEGIIPFTLAEWGIAKNELPILAKESFTKGRMDNNIVDLQTDDILMILKELYSD